MPPGIEIGPITIRFYGIILMLGTVAAAFLAEREARRRGMESELVWDALIWVIIGGILGARIWHILTPPPSMVNQGITTWYYLTHPLDALAIWRGGLGIPGTIIGGGIALFLFTRKRGQSFAVWADIVAPAVALGQAIGRWGNFVNQELYGMPTNLPWGISIDNAPGYPPDTKFHPLFLYESLWNLANMAILLWLGRRYSDRLIPGDLLFVFLFNYSLGRFLLEFIRLDSAQVVGININQMVALAVGISSAVILIWRHRKRAGQAVENSA